jgi:hypothetical protein
MTRRGSTRTFVLAVIVLAVVLSATATAFWNGGGSGSGQAVLASPSALTLTAGTPTTLLHPGGAAVVATIATNPNTYPVHIGSLSRDAASGTNGYDVDAGHSACGVSKIGFFSQDNGGAGWTIPPKAGSVDGSLAIAMADSLVMNASAADACQGATFTVHLVAGA